MIKVEVKFTNKDGVEETAQGRLICWHYSVDGPWYSFIALDDDRIVKARFGTGNYSKKIEYIEVVETSISDSHDNLISKFNSNLRIQEES